MADIKQAAQWLEEKECITRRDFASFNGFLWLHIPSGIVLYESEVQCPIAHELKIDDLLADDWELAK